MREESNLISRRGFTQMGGVAAAAAAVLVSSSSDRNRLLRHHPANVYAKRLITSEITPTWDTELLTHIASGAAPAGGTTRR